MAFKSPQDIAVFEGYFSWAEYVGNFIPVFLGNAIGGAVLVALVYWQSYEGHLQSAKSDKRGSKDIQG